MWRSEQGIDTWGDYSPELDEQGRRNADRDKDEQAASEVEEAASGDDEEQSDGRDT